MFSPFSVRPRFIAFEMSDANGHPCSGRHFRANNLHSNRRNAQNHSLACVMRPIACNNIYRSWVGLQQNLFELVNWNETWRIDDDKDYERHRIASSLHTHNVDVLQCVVQLRVQRQICADAWPIWIACVSLLWAKLQAQHFECLQFDFHVDLPVHLPKFIWFAARINWNATTVAVERRLYRHPACRQRGWPSRAIYFFKIFRDSAAVQFEFDWAPPKWLKFSLNLNISMRCLHNLIELQWTYERFMFQSN